MKDKAHRRTGRGREGGCSPPNFGQLRFFGQREKIWAKPVFKDVSILFNYFKDLGPVVQTLDSAIHRINHYPADSVIDFCNTYPLDSDLSVGKRYPPFEQPRPGE